MKLYYTKTSPYARLVRMVILEKGLSERIEQIEAKTRLPDSPYYQINPSGRVPYLIADKGFAIEDSQLICTYLDQLDGKPTLTLPLSSDGWAYGRLEAYARSFVDGLSVYIREMRRPQSERSATVLVHETDRAVRLADFWEHEVGHALMQGPINLAQLLLIAGLDLGAFTKIADLEGGRPNLARWSGGIRQRLSVVATGPGTS